MFVLYCDGVLMELELESEGKRTCSREEEEEDEEKEKEKRKRKTRGSFLQHVILIPMNIKFCFSAINSHTTAHNKT